MKVLKKIFLFLKKNFLWILAFIIGLVYMFSKKGEPEAVKKYKKQIDNINDNLNELDKKETKPDDFKNVDSATLWDRIKRRTAG